MNSTQKVGALGEDIACRFLVKQGFRIDDRNYRRKWGEIDIVARKQGILYFVEVKTEAVDDVTRKTVRPEEKVHPQKLKRLSRVTQTYLLDKGIEDYEWEFCVVVVLLNQENKEARIRFIVDVL